MMTTQLEVDGDSIPTTAEKMEEEKMEEEKIEHEKGEEKKNEKKSFFSFLKRGMGKKTGDQKTEKEKRKGKDKKKDGPCECINVRVLGVKVR